MPPARRINSNLAPSSDARFCGGRVTDVLGHDFHLSRPGSGRELLDSGAGSVVLADRFRACGLEHNLLIILAIENESVGLTQLVLSTSV